MNKEYKALAGYSGHRKVLVGFASAYELCQLSFVDVLDELTGEGYQRRFNHRHSLDFQKYIQKSEATTIPLTFNLRPEMSKYWEITENTDGTAKLLIKDSQIKVLSQVDCQHRLGFLEGIDIPLSYMIFIGLNKLEEMEVFNTINAKAKGLSGSLTDYHELKLVGNIEKERPELVIAVKLNQDPESPWYQQLDIGGNRVSGMQRRASLRTMQKAVKRFLKEAQISDSNLQDRGYEIIRNFWRAVSLVLSDQWDNPRKHFITKGIGVYSLMSICADLYVYHMKKYANPPTESAFFQMLELFLPKIDWSSDGPFKGLGGESGVKEATAIMRNFRDKNLLKVV